MSEYVQERIDIPIVLAIEIPRKFITPVFSYIFFFFVHRAMNLMNVMAYFVVKNIGRHSVPQHWDPVPPPDS